MKITKGFFLAIIFLSADSVNVIEPLLKIQIQNFSFLFPNVEFSVFDIEFMIRNSFLFERYRLIEIEEVQKSRVDFVSKDILNKINPEFFNDLPDQEMKFKASFIKDKFNFSTCRTHLKYRTFNLPKPNYVESVFAYEEFTFNVGVKVINACVIITNFNTKLLSEREIFWQSSPGNWFTFFDIIGMIILGFAEIHFIGQTLHGNIGPHSILLIERRYFSEPIIIGFADSLEKGNIQRASRCKLRYTISYRPPELSDISTTDDFEDSMKWKKNCDQFFYSDDFKEDVYALANTLLYLLDRNSRDIDQSQFTHKKLKVLIQDMMTARESRINMIEVLKRYLKIAYEGKVVSSAQREIEKRSGSVFSKGYFSGKDNL